MTHNIFPGDSEDWICYETLISQIDFKEGTTGMSLNEMIKLPTLISSLSTNSRPHWTWLVIGL